MHVLYESIATADKMKLQVSVSRKADMKSNKPNHETELDKLSVDQPVPLL